MNDAKMIGTVVGQGSVQAEWIDINSHMNVAYYVLAFDFGIDDLWTQFGITDDYLEHEKGSTFAVECHIEYKSELLLGDPYVITSQLLAYDEKRVHQFQRMYHAERKHLVATAEWMNLHVSLETRRVTPWPAKILASIGAFAATQHDQTRPEGLGKKMVVKKPLYTL